MADPKDVELADRAYSKAIELTDALNECLDAGLTAKPPEWIEMQDGMGKMDRLVLIHLDINRALVPLRFGPKGER